jgi:hypothetical protein
MPKLFPPPFKAQKRSEFSLAVAMTTFPLARTTYNSDQRDFYMKPQKRIPYFKGNYIIRCESMLIGIEGNAPSQQ